MIRLIHTPHEYLIALPYEQRSRAKRIPHYKWDPREKLWRYPRNESTLHAIMAELGPDETDVEFRDIDPEDAAQDLENFGDSLRRQLEDLRDSIEQKRILVDLFHEAEKYGLPEDSDLDQMINFTKAAYEGNYKHADLAVQLATSAAKLDDAKKEVAGLRRQSGSAGEEGFRTTLLQEAWGSDSMPQILKNFTFDGQGAIDLQNFLVMFLSKALHKESTRSSFVDLIREAQDSEILSDSSARVCHTLRIQRNYFAHESVSPRDVLPRASLCLYSFIIVYRELLSGDSAL